MIGAEKHNPYGIPYAYFWKITPILTILLLCINQSLKWSIIDLAADIYAPEPILSAIKPPLLCNYF